MMTTETTNHEIKFVTATENDLTALCDLINSAYRGESSKKGWTTEADLIGGQRTDVKALKEQLEEECSEIILAKENKKILGCVYLKRLAIDETYLGMLTVSPQAQGLGLGKKLLQHAEQWATKNNCTTIKMNVIAQRPELIAWYERHGYTNTQETEAFPYGNDRFGLPKVQDLFFYILKKRI